MTTRGPRPQSAALKIVTGNPGKRPAAKPKTKPSSDAKPGSAVKPRFLKGRAAAIWKQYAPELKRLGILTPLRVHQFALYCTVAAELEQKGTLSASQMTQMNSLAGSFGMNGDPRLVPAPGTEKTKDPAEKYF